MALNATHFRIAHDLASDLGVVDFAAYYEGTIYPDTRYITGIRRTLTHHEGCPQDPFTKGLTDFQKGWAVHLLYDELSKKRQRLLIPKAFGEVSGFNDAWIYGSAIKFVEDRASAEVLGDAIDPLRHLCCTTTPRGESPEIIQRYLEDIAKLYEEIPPGIETYKKFYGPIFQNEVLATKLFETGEEILRDAELTTTIVGIYALTLDDIRAERP